MKYTLTLLVAIVLGTSASADGFEIPKVTAPAAVAAGTTITGFSFTYDIATIAINVDGSPTLVLQEGMTAAVDYFCSPGSGDPVVLKNVAIGAPVELNHDGFEISVTGAKDSGITGSASVEMVCPLPAATSVSAQHVRDTWKMHLGHGSSEFTDGDLRKVLTHIAQNPQGQIINKLDVSGGWWGNDKSYILDAVKVGNSPTGQLTGWIVQGELVKYYIVTDVCLEICHGPVVIWHLHPPKVVAKKKHVATPAPRRIATPKAATRSCPQQMTINITGGENCTGSCAAVKAAEAAARAAMNNC